MTNTTLYAPPCIGAATTLLAILLGLPAIVPAITALTVFGWVAGWFVLAYRYERRLLVDADARAGSLMIAWRHERSVHPRLPCSGKRRAYPVYYQDAYKRS